MSPFSLSERGGVRITQRDASTPRGKDEAWSGHHHRNLSGERPGSKPHRPWPSGSFRASVLPQQACHVTCGLKRSHFPGGLRILRPSKRKTDMLYTDFQVSRPPHLGQTWVGWVGLKHTQARFPEGSCLSRNGDGTIEEVISCTCVSLKYANSRSFLGSPNQCDPGASLSENIGGQGIQEA